MKKGDFKVFCVDGELFNTRIYTLLSGKSFKQLNKFPGGRAVGSAANEKTDTFLIHDIVREMPAEFAIRVTELLNRFKDEGALVSYHRRHTLFEKQNQPQAFLRVRFMV